MSRETEGGYEPEEKKELTLKRESVIDDVLEVFKEAEILTEQGKYSEQFELLVDKFKEFELIKDAVQKELDREEFALIIHERVQDEFHKEIARQKREKSSDLRKELSAIIIMEGQYLDNIKELGSYFAKLVEKLHQTNEEENTEDKKIDFEVATIKAVNSIEVPDWIKKELEAWNSRISNASADELMAMIPEATDISHKEEALAREFVRRKIDTKEFLENAKFRTTKAILEGRLKE